mmetsp:Transcript_5173/g.11989  ORF Transcript_5173/g.11989 Transcript_5173/m.11989 type:complete len:379 (-) Transcript_5173:1192-2328(-)
MSLGGRGGGLTPDRLRAARSDKEGGDRVDDPLQGAGLVLGRRCDTARPLGHPARGHHAVAVRVPELLLPGAHRVLHPAPQRPPLRLCVGAGQPGHLQDGGRRGAELVVLVHAGLDPVDKVFPGSGALLAEEVPCGRRPRHEEVQEVPELELRRRVLVLGHEHEGVHPERRLGRHEPSAPDVRREGVLVPRHALGRHVGHGPDPLLGGELRGLGAHAEVGELDAPVDREEDVARLHVAVHHLVRLVEVRQGAEESGADGADGVQRDARLGGLHQVEEGAPVDELHDEVEGRVGEEDLVAQHDARVLHVGHRPHLVHDHGLLVLVLRHGNLLEGDRNAVLAVVEVGLPHHTPVPLAEGAHLAEHGHNVRHCVLVQHLLRL